MSHFLTFWSFFSLSDHKVYVTNEYQMIACQDLQGRIDASPRHQDEAVVAAEAKPFVPWVVVISNLDLPLHPVTVANQEFYKG